MRPDQLQELANSQGCGYLKHWKAASMLVTLSTIPGILDDSERLRKYVASCLQMEGFSGAGIDAITGALLSAFPNQHKPIN